MPERGHEAGEKAPEAQPESAGVAAAGFALTPSVAGMLALQRTIGNRGVGAALSGAPRRVLARYGIEGSLNLKDPVHETLTLLAIKAAKEKARAAGAAPGDLIGAIETKDFPRLYSPSAHEVWPEYVHSSAQQYVRGVQFPDDPEGLLHNRRQDATNYSSGAVWYAKFKAANRKTNLTARSHHGDLQFLHGMASSDTEDPTATRSKILTWARFLVDTATGRLNLDQAMEDVPGMGPYFKGFEQGGYTVRAFFGWADAKDLPIRQRAAGALCHLIQDSHAKGHVERDASTGEIVEFHSYTNQDHDKHGAHDAWPSGAYLLERLRKLPGAVRAIDKCATALALLDRNASTDEVMKFLEEEVFKLSAGVRKASPGAGLGTKKYDKAHKH